MPTIHAAVSSKILNKVDRMFSNRMTQIFIELIQNARRAGATLITVATLDSPDGIVINFEDNGVGIDDFSKLLHLGDGNALRYSRLSRGSARLIRRPPPA